MTSREIVARLTRECCRSPALVAAALASLVVFSASELFLTWVAKLWLEELLARSDSDAILRLMSIGALSTGVLVTALFLSRYLLAAINQGMVQRLRDQAQSRLIGAELPALREARSGDLLSRVFNDVGAVSGFAEAVLKRVVGEGLVTVGAIAMMVYIEWRLTLTALVLVPVLALVVGRLGPLIRRRGAVAQEEVGGLTAILSEQLAGISTVKGFQAEENERRRFVEQNVAHRRQALRGEWWAAMALALVWLITGLGLVGMLWGGSRLVVSRTMTEAELFSFGLYAVQTIEPLRRMGEVYGLLQRILGAASRVYEIIDFSRMEAPGGTRLPALVRGEVRFEGVSFRYQADLDVLKDVSLRFQPGEAVGVVAESGGGKSTLASLLLRFRRPSSGRILLDGIDLGEIDLAELRRVVCLVEQDPFVFAGSIADNVRYGSWHAPRSSIDAAVAAVGLVPLVESGSDGLDGWLQEGGKSLSGGQKQRIALARAIVRDPRVLILDEATSALDSDTEAQIFSQIEGWLARRTVLVMAHRLSTISRFDRVVLLDGGRVAAEGPIAELGRSRAFQRLFADQVAPLEPRREGLVSRA